MINVGRRDGFGQGTIAPDGPAVLDIVLDGAEVGVWVLDLNTGRTTTKGPYGRILTGRPTEPGFTFPSYEAFLEVVHPDDRERIAGSVDRNRGSSQFEDEFRIVTPTGDVRWVLSRSRVVPDDHGGRGRVVGVVMDVTERHAAYEQHRAIAETLQQSLLPYQLPSVPGVRLAAAYRPGEPGAAVGGDWYDALALADGRVAVTIGDVAGHGIEAAHTMGRLRDVTRLLVAEGRPIEEVLARLNRLILGLDSEAIATAACVIVDPNRGRAVWSSAGHVPPLLVPPSGVSTFLDATCGPALGAMPNARYVLHEIALEPGSLILLYTDGLVERRGEHMHVGLERLANLVTATPRSAAAQCATLTGEGGPLPGGDDVAVVAVEIRPCLEPLNVRLPCEAESLARLRAELRTWLQTAVDTDTVDDLVQATSEAAAKLVTRAPVPSEEFGVRASSAGDAVEIAIRTWQATDDEPGWPGTDGARALRIMEALTDELIVLHHPKGSEVVLRRLTP